MRHADQLQEFIDSFAQNSAPQPEQMPVELEKLPAREVVVKVGRFGKKSQTCLGARIAHVQIE